MKRVEKGVVKNSFVRVVRVLGTQAVFLAACLATCLGAEFCSAQESPAATKTAVKALAQQVVRAVKVLQTEPRDGRCHVIEFDGAALPAAVSEKLGGLPLGEMRVLLVRGTNGAFRLDVNAEIIGRATLGQADRPWMLSPRGTLFLGDKTLSDAGFSSPLPFLRDDVRQQIESWLDVVKAFGAMAAAGIVGGDSMDLSKILDAQTADGLRAAFRRIELDADASEFSFAPEMGEKIGEPQITVTNVATEDLSRQFSALVNFATDRFLPSTASLDFGQKRRNDPEVKTASENAEMKVVARASHGRGMLAEQSGRRILFLEGTPAEMGAAQGELLAVNVRRLVERVLYGVGAATSLESGRWFFDELTEIERRTTPFIPPRFFAEVDALAEAAGVSQRDGRFANFFPERFHCSGVAVCGKASKDGRVYHARVLDYMSDILLQDESCLHVFLPTGYNAWMSHSYGGFVGTVTAMNEKGLAMGEMGGRGEGAWDGLPMSFLMREVMETTSNVDEAVALLQKTPRTCEYYYVLSDSSRRMVAIKSTPEELLVLHPGEQHPLLPQVPEDTVFISEGDRAEELSRRLHQHYGKIDAEILIEIIKRPVAMRSNLHNAIFVPEALEMWVSDAGTGISVTPACDSPYHTFRWDELLKFYRENAR